MIRSTEGRIRLGMAVACLAIAGPVAAYYGVGATGQLDESCKTADMCTVAGAEADDAATAALRLRVGTGPRAGYLADSRLETDATVVGTLANGVKIYSFKFVFDDTVRVGVVAQELLERADTRGAVLTMANGLYGVDYAALGLREATEAQWKQAGLQALNAGYRPGTRAKAKGDGAIALRNGQKNN